MYSRYPGRLDRPVQLPEHYSGCAFSASAPSRIPTDLPPISVPYTPVPSPEPPDETDPPPSPPPLPPSPDTPPEHKKGATPDALPEGLRALFGGRLPAFPGGMTFDELLLLGLILLLAHSEQQSDIILWLALLLFCK